MTVITATSRASGLVERLRAKGGGYEHPLYRKPPSLLPGGRMAVKLDAQEIAAHCDQDPAYSAVSVSPAMSRTRPRPTQGRAFSMPSWVSPVAAKISA